MLMNTTTSSSPKGLRCGKGELPVGSDAAGRAWKRGEETSDAFDLATLLAWMRAAKGGALKLGPGVARELVTAADAECEYIEVDGVMEQCVVWTGALASNAGTTRATQLGGAAITRFGVPRGVPQAEALGAYLFEPCASIERAGLLADLAQELDAAEVAPGLGLLTGNVAHTSRWAECFDIAGTVAQTLDSNVSGITIEVATAYAWSFTVEPSALSLPAGYYTWAIETTDADSVVDKDLLSGTQQITIDPHA